MVCKIGIIIPTKDRPDELRRFLRSLETQDSRAEQVIIVDGGINTVSGLAAEFPGLEIDYLRRVPASLTLQRNAGIAKLKKEITVVIFFDDDIILEKDSLRRMAEFWARAGSDVGGAAFNLINEGQKRSSLLERVFIGDTHVPGVVLRSGFQGKVSCVSADTPVKWIVGCSMAFRKSVFDEFMFDQRFSGYSRYEDLDFSYRVSRKYRMYIVADARVTHLNKVEDIGFSFSLGRMEVVNRLYFVSKNPELSSLLCFRALLGMLMNNMFKGVILRDERCRRRAAGNLAGLWDILSRDSKAERRV